MRRTRPEPFDFVQVLEGSLDKYCTDRIDFLGEIGSSIESLSDTLFSDIDVVCVFSRPPEHDKANIEVYEHFIRLMKRLQTRILDDYNLRYTVFPTYRVEDLVRYLLSARKRPSNTYTFVHLLAYPSWFHLSTWEPQSLAEKILWTAKSKGRERIDVPALFERGTFEDRIQPMISLLYETYRLLECSALPKEPLVWEATHKITFIVKHLTAEILIKEGYDPTKAYLWRTMEDLPRLRLESAPSIVAEAVKIRTSHRLPSVTRIRKVASETMDYVKEALRLYA